MPPTAVVGVSDSPSSVAALAWASRHCAEQGWHLQVVTVWPGRGELMVEESPGCACPPRQRAVAALNEAIRECGIVLDDPAVQVYVDNGDVAHALARRAVGARMLVLGASRYGNHRRAGFAPLSQVCRSHVSCPVVIVDTDDVDATPPVRTDGSQLLFT